MQDHKTMISMCAEQEEKFQFEHFSREDALKIGLKLHENAKEQPVAVEITVNGLVVFRYFAEGVKPDSELWLEMCIRDRVVAMALLPALQKAMNSTSFGRHMAEK